MTNQTPLPTNDNARPQYGGFWIRFGAYWLDALILMPFSLLVTWLNGLNREIFFFTFIPSLAVSIFFHVYCVKRWGGSPGKLICGLRIVSTSLQAAGWREAWLRYSILLAVSLLSMAVYIYALNQMSDAEYLRLSFLERSKRIVELGGSMQTAATWLTQIWVWSEFIVLLTNKQRRALHDFVAGTLVIKNAKIA